MLVAGLGTEADGLALLCAFQLGFARKFLGQREGQGQRVALIEQPKWLNVWLIDQFVRWREGGPAMETAVDANLQAAALIFASIESKRSGKPIEVQDYIRSFG